MRSWAIVLVWAAALAVAAGCDYQRATGAEGPGDGSYADQVAILVNDIREALGCGRLVWDPELAEVAAGHARDMADREYFGHVSPDGLGLKARLREQGFRYYALAAENIARGFRDGHPPESVVAGWVESDGHREIIETCGFEYHGVAFHEYHWVHLFLRP